MKKTVLLQKHVPVYIVRTLLSGTYITCICVIYVPVIVDSISVNINS